MTLKSIGISAVLLLAAAASASAAAGSTCADPSDGAITTLLAVEGRTSRPRRGAASGRITSILPNTARPKAAVAPGSARSTIAWRWPRRVFAGTAESAWSTNSVGPMTTSVHASRAARLWCCCRTPALSFFGWDLVPIVRAGFAGAILAGCQLRLTALEHREETKRRRRRRNGERRRASNE